MNEATRALLQAGGRTYSYYAVSGVGGHERLPLALTVLLENVLRNAPDACAADEQVARIVEAGLGAQVGDEVSFSPARVLFQDFTGVPVFVDFAVMREACAALGGDPRSINPQVPCDLVIDHSVIADEAGHAGCMGVNMALEYERNAERYSFLKWAQESFENVRIVAPGAGICHQLNIEQFAQVAMVDPAAADDAEAPLVYFDTLVGTDSHTPTANGIGVLGWGVGGIEAEAAALGQPITTLVPQVIGVHLTGSLASGVSAMDVSLTFAEMLRRRGVVGCFVECFGEGVAALSATQRACISNMTPEYGCTCTLFPVDERTLDYLRVTGRSAEQVALVEAYAKAQGTWNDPAAPQRVYADVLELDLSQVTPRMAGPSRPHDGFARAAAAARFAEVGETRGLDAGKVVEVEVGGQRCELRHGAIAIAAITSCTTATDPAMMLACGLMARNAARAGLRSAPWVKTILAPGSQATELLLARAGLLDPLAELGFHTCGFGCMSCIGNSGPLSAAMHDAAAEIELASVLSGNRNFEGRISPDVAQNYLAAPATVVAYALAGRMDVDFAQDALGFDAEGAPVYLADIEPDPAELEELIGRLVTPRLYADGAAVQAQEGEAWAALGAQGSDLFPWDAASTYVRRAPYFDGMTREAAEPAPIEDARVLALLGDFITTDHISPAGSIAPDSPAARYLAENGIAPTAFNTYGSRRGNHEVLMRGTFANVRLANKLAPGKLGGWTRDAGTGELTSIFDAAMRAAADGVPLVVVAGKMYGSGSSRDWAAKGPALLGVRAVIAESFERIHRSNLIGMGILPLQFAEGQSADTLGLDGSERYSIELPDVSCGQPASPTTTVRARREDGTELAFEVTVRIDTPTEGDYYRNAGILQYVLRDLSA